VLEHISRFTRSIENDCLHGHCFRSGYSIVSTALPRMPRARRTASAVAVSVQ
jgi:hypothetical protein